MKVIKQKLEFKRGKDLGYFKSGDIMHQPSYLVAVMLLQPRYEKGQVHLTDLQVWGMEELEHLAELVCQDCGIDRKALPLKDGVWLEYDKSDYEKLCGLLTVGIILGWEIRFVSQNGDWVFIDHDSWVMTKTKDKKYRKKLRELFKFLVLP